MKNFSLYTVKAVTVFSLTLVLTACGGGSSSTPPVSNSSSLKAFSVKSSSKASSSQVSLSVTSSSIVASSSAIPSSVTSSSVTISLGNEGNSSSSVDVVFSSLASSSEMSSSSEEASSSEISSSSEEASSSEVASSSSEISSSSSEESSSSSAESSSSEVSSSSSSIPSSSSSSAPGSIYHVRGTHNNWAEGLLMNPAGSSNTFQSCINFTATTENSFKVDPNGAWGNDSVPAQNYVVSKGWVKILFNSTSKTVTTEQNLGANCLSVLHLRGTHTAVAWAEGDLFTPVAGSATNYEICRNFATGDAKGGPRFKVDPNGAWGADAFPAADVSANGWTKIVINSSTRTIVSKDINLAANCGGSSSSSSSIANN